MRFLESLPGFLAYILILAVTILCLPLVLLVLGVDSLIVWVEGRKWKQ